MLVCVKEINEVREFHDNGNKMVLTLSLPEKPDISAKRIFKKVG